MSGPAFCNEQLCIGVLSEWSYARKAASFRVSYRLGLRNREGLQEMPTLVIGVVAEAGGIPGGAALLEGSSTVQLLRRGCRGSIHLFTLLA